MNQLIQLLDQVSLLSPDLKKHLRSIIKKRIFKKGEIILPEGDICNSIYFIESGLIRSYYLLDQKEVSNWFMRAGDIFISVLSFFRQIPSLDIHVALEDTVCWGILHTELEKTYVLYPEFNKHGRLISNEYYCRSEERQMDLKRQTPQHKYELLMAKDPDLVLRINNSHMASYLDVSDRTYNDIRKEYANKMKKKPK